MAEVDDPPTEWFNTDNAAAELGIGRVTLYRLINCGQLPAFKIGRVFRVRRADIDAYLESVRIQPGDLDNLVRNSDDETDIAPSRRSGLSVVVGVGLVREARGPGSGP